MDNPKIYAAITRVMSEIGAVGKTRRNQQQGYSFRGIDDIYNACQAALVTAGVFCVPRVLDVRREERQSQKGGLLIYTIIRMEYIFYADDGSFVSAIVEGEAMDSGDKSTNKAMSAAQKYAFLQTFVIPTEEHKDSEYDNPQPSAAKREPKKREPKPEATPEAKPEPKPEAKRDPKPEQPEIMTDPAQIERTVMFLTKTIRGCRNNAALDRVASASAAKIAALPETERKSVLAVAAEMRAKFNGSDKPAPPPALENTTDGLKTFLSESGAGARKAMQIVADAKRSDDMSVVILAKQELEDLFNAKEISEADFTTAFNALTEHEIGA